MRSVAWLLRGATGSTEGVLELSGGRLTFTTTGVYQGAPLTGTDERGGEEGRVFDASLSEVTDVTFPWYYFGGGAKLTVGGERYRLSFLKPQNTQLTEYAATGDIPSGRRTGKAWKQALAGR
jgi:hypothetical protein